MAETCDYTFNPWIGCAKVAAGCTHCYAESYANRYGKARWGEHGTRVKTSDANWKKPHKWNSLGREYEEATGRRLRVFCASLADVFEDWNGMLFDSQQRPQWKCQHCGTVQPVTTKGVTLARQCEGCKRTLVPQHPASLDDLRRDLFAKIDATPHLDWLLLTKRPENIRRMWPDARRMPAGDPYRLDGYRRNVWLLTSIATQEDADRNVPELLKCRDLVPVLGLSCEPLVGPVDLDTITLRRDGEMPNELSRQLGDYIEPLTGTFKDSPTIDWVIVGGESGAGARPMHPDWARSIRDQCVAAGVPFFFKQWGEWAPGGDAFPDFAIMSGNGSKCALMQSDGKVDTVGDKATPICRIGKKKAGRLLDGREWDEFPQASVKA